MKKLYLFLRDGKLFYGSSLDDATAFEVVNRELIADVVLMQEGQLYEVAKGWTVEIEDQFKQNDNWFNFKDNPVSLIDAQQLADEGRTRKIARLVKIEKEGVLLEEPQYVDFNKPNIFIDGDFNDSYEARVRRSTGKGKSKIPLKEQSSGIAAVGVPEYDFKYDLRETNPIKEALKDAGIPESGEKPVRVTFGLQPEHIAFIEERAAKYGGLRSDWLWKDVGEKIGWHPHAACSYYADYLRDKLKSVSPPPQAEDTVSRRAYDLLKANRDWNAEQLKKAPQAESQEDCPGKCKFPNCKCSLYRRVIVAGVADRQGISNEILNLWEQVQIWYGDIRKEETDEQFLRRIQNTFTITRKAKP